MLFLKKTNIIIVSSGGIIMQRYFAKVVDNRVILSDSDIHHIKNVMRMNIGDKIEVVNDNILYICSITELTPVRVNIEEIRKEDNKINLDVVIAIGLVKEQKMDLILQDANYLITNGQRDRDILTKK